MEPRNMMICSGSGPSVFMRDDNVDEVRIIVNAAAAARTDPTSRSSEARLTRRSRSIDLTVMSSSTSSPPRAPPELRITEKRTMPNTPDRAPNARNVPMAVGDSPMVTKYAVRTMPVGLNAVRYSDASASVRRGRPEE